MGRKTAAILLGLLLLAGSSAAWAGGESGDPLSLDGVFAETFLNVRNAQFELAGDLMEKALIQSDLADLLVDAVLDEEDPDLLNLYTNELDQTENLIVGILTTMANEACPECGDPDCEGCGPETCPGCDDPECPDCNPEEEGCPGCDDPECPDCNPEEEGCPGCGDPECEGCPEVCPECEDGTCMDCLIREIFNDQDERGWRLREIVLDESMPMGAREGALKALQNQARTYEQWAWSQSGEEGPPPWANARINRPGNGEEGNGEEGNGEEGNGEEGNGEEGNGEEGSGEEGSGEEGSGEEGSVSITGNNNNGPGKGHPGRGRGSDPNFVPPGLLKKR